MSMILEFLVGGGAGGVVGLVGAYLTKLEERKVLQIKNTHEKDMGNLRLREQEAEQNHELAVADKQIQKAEVEGQIRLDEAEIKGWATTLTDEMSKSTLGAMVKGAMRPAITLYLLGIVTYLTINIWTLTAGLESVDKYELLDILKQIIAQVLFLTVTCTTWWFGARASSKPAITIGVKS